MNPTYLPIQAAFGNLVHILNVPIAVGVAITVGYVGGRFLTAIRTLDPMIGLDATPVSNWLPLVGLVRSHGLGRSGR